MNIGIPTPALRTEEDLKHQSEYERREAALHTSDLQIHYEVIERWSNESETRAGKKTVEVWVLVKSIGDKQQKSAPYFRRKDVIESLRLSISRDNQAAERLGLKVYITTKTR
jgi:hypothetical protein